MRFKAVLFDLGGVVVGSPLEISLTTFEPLTPALVAQATQAGVDRLIVMPRVRAEQLEATVRALGAQFAHAG